MRQKPQTKITLPADFIKRVEFMRSRRPDFRDKPISRYVVHLVERGLEIEEDEFHGAGIDPTWKT